MNMHQQQGKFLMISLSNSLNRVQIISAILIIKLSEAPPSHSHLELVSSDLSSQTQSFSVPYCPWLGVTHTKWLADIKLQPRALSWATNSLTPRLLDMSTWTGHKLPRSSMSETNSSGSCLCLQAHSRPNGWMCAVEPSQKASSQ